MAHLLLCTSHYVIHSSYLESLHNYISLSRCAAPGSFTHISPSLIHIPYHFVTPKPIPLPHPEGAHHPLSRDLSYRLLCWLQTYLICVSVLLTPYPLPFSRIAWADFPVWCPSWNALRLTTSPGSRCTSQVPQRTNRRRWQPCNFSSSHLCQYQVRQIFSYPVVFDLYKTINLLSWPPFQWVFSSTHCF